MDRVEKCIKIMKRIARINGKTVDDAVYKEFYDSNINNSTAEEDKVNYTVLDLFKTARMRKITIVSSPKITIPTLIL